MTLTVENKQNLLVNALDNWNTPLLKLKSDSNVWTQERMVDHYGKTTKISTHKQVIQVIFKESLAIYLPYENRARNVLCTVWSSSVFHISNSRQHAVCSKEQENKCQALIRLVWTVWNFQIIYPCLCPAASQQNINACTQALLQREGYKTLKMSSSSRLPYHLFPHLFKKSNNSNLRL